MDIFTFLALFIGPVSALLGVWLAHRFEKERGNHRAMLDAKTVSFSEFGGITRTMISQGFDRQKLSEFNDANSRAMLFAGSELREMLRDFGSEIHQRRHKSEDNRYSFKTDDVTILVDKINDIEEEMREEILK